ncbi:MAG: HEAT repeat domain-containing protein [Acidobacteria bacterium]|nr:HEAT repeat domain-containing protein [Acidobacteriota bacterium]
MNCDSISTLIPLYYYGELSPGQEDAVEEHIHACRDCARAMEAQRTLAAALDRRQMEVPPLLLEDCRADLTAALSGGARRAAAVAPPPKSPWALFLAAVAHSLVGMERLRQPIGALALLAIGFFGARLTAPRPATPSSAAPDDIFTTVRSVQPDSAGHVQIAYDETRRNVVRGRVDDPNIQRLMLAGAHEDNPAVRVESVGVLKDRAGSTEVRDALLNAISGDSNPGVRLKALEGLKPLAGDAEVRKVLSRVLVSDDNPAVRMQVVDLLVAHRDDYMVGLMQGLVQRENNDSVRLKLEKALKDMNASVGTF